MFAKEGRTKTAIDWSDKLPGEVHPVRGPFSMSGDGSGGGVLVGQGSPFHARPLARARTCGRGRVRSVGALLHHTGESQMPQNMTVASPSGCAWQDLKVIYD
ncbi:hypothetical protein GCM10027562_24070 [Arthrobacter pigmenti]